MTFEVLTWNVDWFRNGHHSNNDSSKYHFCDCDKTAFDSICNNIKTFLDEDVSADKIAFLQECPFKNYDNDKWVVHSYWESLKQIFPANEYDIFLSKDTDRGFVTRKTIAIARKGVFVQHNLNHNRLVAVEKAGIKLVGVHMPPINYLTDDNDTVWVKLLDFIVKEKKVIIAGDFNTYIDCKHKSTEYRYRELLSLADNIVVESIATFSNNTSIDKILVGKGLNIKSYGVIPQQKFEYSDHRYIKARIIV